VNNNKDEEKLTVEFQEHDEQRLTKPKKRKKNPQQRFKRMASKNLNENGHLYVELLLEAYDEKLINDLDLSNELGVPYTVIPFVIDRLNGGR
jgi:hypothetical protein